MSWGEAYRRVFRLWAGRRERAFGEILFDVAFPKTFGSNVPIAILGLPETAASAPMLN